MCAINCSFKESCSIENTAWKNVNQLYKHSILTDTLEHCAAQHTTIMGAGCGLGIAPPVGGQHITVTVLLVQVKVQMNNSKEPEQQQRTL